MQREQLLGRTTDNCQREVDIFSDGESVYAVYNKDTDEEHATTPVLISEIKNHPDDYLFTPYIEFVPLV